MRTYFNLFAWAWVCSWGSFTKAVAQSPSTDRQRYKAAYQLIRRSAQFREFAGQHPRVAVYDSLIPADRTAFYAELLAPRQLTAFLLDSLARVAQQPTRYSADVARLTKSSPLTQGTYIVAFAPAEANCLIAEVTYNRYGPLNFSRLPMFGQSLVYLIYFDSQLKPGRVHTRTLLYN